MPGGLKNTRFAIWLLGSSLSQRPARSPFLARSLGEVVEDRALVDAVARPGPGQAEHRHPPLEPAEQGLLLGGQADAPVHRLPSRPLGLRRITIQERSIGNSRFEVVRPVHEGY